MKERLFTIVLLLSAFVLNASSQKAATVKSFVQTTDHISGSDRRNDMNGVPCALVKVQVVDDISRVEGNRIGNIVTKGVEKWVYMCKGSRNMRIHLKNHLPVKIMFADYKISGLESNRVYELVITTSDEPKHGNPLVCFSVTPKHSIIYVDNSLYELDENGMLKLYLTEGTHNYKIDATGGYESAEETFIVKKSDITKKISLKSKKANLCIRTSDPTASIYVNDVLKGQGQWMCDTMPGTYKVVAELDGHKKYEQFITLVKNEQKTIEIPPLTPIYGSINVDYAPAGSDVYIDGKLTGKTPLVVEQLITGKHIIDIKKGHKEKTLTINLSEGKEILIVGELESSTPTPSEKGEVTIESWSTLTIPDEAVDLGLSVKWAFCDLIMVDSHENDKDIFAWGETTPKKKYTEKNYLHNTGITNGTGELGTGNDAAHSNWGGKWRMPTSSEMLELIEKCELEWNNKGVMFIGPNGNKIFLKTNGSTGEYWTSTQGTKPGSTALHLYINEKIHSIVVKEGACYEGRFIRPVTDK